MNKSVAIVSGVVVGFASACASGDGHPGYVEDFEEKAVDETVVTVGIVPVETHQEVLVEHQKYLFANVRICAQETDAELHQLHLTKAHVPVAGQTVQPWMLSFCEAAALDASCRATTMTSIGGSMDLTFDEACGIQRDSCVTIAVTCDVQRILDEKVYGDFWLTFGPRDAQGTVLTTTDGTLLEVESVAADPTVVYQNVPSDIAQ